MDTNYWWVIVLLAIVVSAEIRYALVNFLNALDTPLLFILFLFALYYWSQTK